MSEHTHTEWCGAIQRAVAAHDVKAIPALLAGMALDGHADAAERIRLGLLRVVEHSTPVTEEPA